MPNPTDPVKKVTRGETTTTTSTRRGVNDRGIKGTFTDTTESTPVTTTTTNNNGGSDEFKKAFAAAKKAGLPTFTFGKNEYNTNTSDSSTNNETSTSSTFQRDKLTPLPKLEGHGIKFSPQSYKMGETQKIQRPGADAMHVLAVGRNNPKGGTRDYHMVQKSGDGNGYFQGKQAITQDYRTMTLEQKEGLIKNVNLSNKLLNDKYSPEAITKNISKNWGETTDPRVLANREAHLKKKVAEGQTRIKNNTAFYKTPGKK